jgi:hypothetical protein
MGVLRHVVELKACSTDDPDGQHSAAVLAAYFNVEEAQAFRRTLWRQALAVAIIASLLEATTSFLPKAGFLVALAAIAAIAAVGALAEHRATRTLRALL